MELKPFTPSPLPEEEKAIRRAAREDRAVSLIADILEHEPGYGDRAYLARDLLRVTFPYRDPHTNEYERRNGNLSLILLAHSSVGLPFGSYPRLVRYWLETEAVKTRSRALHLGDSYRSFLRNLNLPETGTVMRRVMDQTRRLFSCHISVRYDDKGYMAGAGLTLASKYYLLWDPKKPAERALFEKDSTVELSEEYFQLIVNAPVPVDFRALRYLQRSPLCLDLYTWLPTRYYSLAQTAVIPLPSLMLQFGTDFPNTPQGVRDFRKKLIKALGAVKQVYPAAKFDVTPSGLELYPSKVPIPALRGV